MRVEATVCDGCGQGGLDVIRIGEAAPAVCAVCQLPHAKGEPPPTRAGHSDGNKDAEAETPDGGANS